MRQDGKNGKDSYSVDETWRKFKIGRNRWTLDICGAITHKNQSGDLKPSYFKANFPLVSLLHHTNQTTTRTTQSFTQAQGTTPQPVSIFFMKFISSTELHNLNSFQTSNQPTSSTKELLGDKEFLKSDHLQLKSHDTLAVIRMHMGTANLCHFNLHPNDRN